MQASRLMDFVAYLREEERSEGTIKKYLRDIRKYIRFAGENLDKTTLIGWKNQLIEENYAPQTINSMLAAVNRFMDYLGKGTEKVKPVKCQRSVFRAEEKELTKPEYFRLLEAARQSGDQRLFLIMETICATGIRISELKYITVQAVLSGRVNVRCKGKCRDIRIPRSLCKQLKKWIKSKKIASGPVFQTKGGKPIDRSNIWRQMKRLCEQAKVAPEKVFPHNLRHLFAVVFYTAVKDIAKLADILGHTSINTTRIYIMESGMEHERQLSQLGLVVS